MAKTTTVVFTDLVGSTPATAAMGDDGYAAAFTAHVAILRAEIERRDGRITKLLGDGVMALFDSSYEAVKAAVEMHRVVEWAARHGDGPAFQLRVGVNVGEVVAGEGDLFGMAVVLARRLCDAAAPGEILASELVRLLVGNRTDVTFEPVEPLDLKGIDGRTAAARVCWTPRPAEATIRVVVADDAALIRAGVVRLLSDGGFMVEAEVGDADALLEAVDRLTPDLVITDIRMPPTFTDEGLRAASAIRHTHPDTAVLVLSQHIEAGAAAELLDSGPGGLGYLLKERVTELDEFLSAARTVAGGGSVIDPLVSEQLLRRRSFDHSLARLSDREREVLALMAQGKSNTAIADALFVGAKTVETHVRAIFQKLDLAEKSDEHRRVLAVIRWLTTPTA